ncbi:unnamed protein product, partial [marine sediment metagenome]
IGTVSLLNMTQIGINPAEGKRIRLFKVTGNADLASPAITDIIKIYKEAAGTYAQTLVTKSPVLTNQTDYNMTFTTNQPCGGIDFAVNERVIVNVNGDEYQEAGAGVTVYYLEW